MAVKLKKNKLKLEKINKELSEYPQPVSGCDAQYTWLLQQRENLLGNFRKIIDRVENDHKFSVDTEEYRTKTNKK
ncbi:hypothetical protein [Candidatus Pelagibacter sp.]|uniref:hypothetical protein n=1 Tax=Candidatus Pelagibacter sp. TaxID=2024849 RepID=UPI003F8351C6